MTINKPIKIKHKSTPFNTHIPLGEMNNTLKKVVTPIAIKTFSLTLKLYTASPMLSASYINSGVEDRF